MRTICTLTLLSALALAGPEVRIRYREGTLETALAEAKATGRVVLVVVEWYG